MHVYICITVADQSSDNRPSSPIPKMSPDHQPIVGRRTADDRPMQNRRVCMNIAVHIFNVNVRRRPI